MIGFINSNDLYIYYSQTYYMFFGAVADGYLYAVRSPIYEEENYYFDFLYTGSTSTLLMPALLAPQISVKSWSPIQAVSSGRSPMRLQAAR